MTKNFDQLTVNDADFATLVIRAEGNSIALFGGHYAHSPQAVGTLDVRVIVWVILRQDVLRTAGIQRSLDGVPAIWFIPPCDNRTLTGGGCLVITVEGDGLEEDHNVPLCGTLDRDAHDGL